MCVVWVVKYLVFMFFKQKTAYEMRISDWSSDVCSSDLRIGVEEFLDAEAVEALQHPVFLRPPVLELLQHRLVETVLRDRIGRQTHRQRLHGHAPPGGRRHHAKVEGTGALVLGPAVAEQFVVRMAVPRSEERRGGKEGVGTGVTGWTT